MDLVNPRKGSMSPQIRVVSITQKIIECWNCGKIEKCKKYCKNAPKNQDVKAETNLPSILEGDDALSLQENYEIETNFWRPK